MSNNLRRTAMILLVLVLAPRTAWPEEIGVGPGSDWSAGIVVSEGVVPCMSGVYRSNVRFELAATLEFDESRWDLVRFGAGIEPPWAVSVGTAYVFDLGAVFVLFGVTRFESGRDVLYGPEMGIGYRARLAAGWFFESGVTGGIYPTHALSHPLLPVEANLGARHEL